MAATARMGCRAKSIFRFMAVLYRTLEHNKVETSDAGDGKPPFLTSEVSIRGFNPRSFAGREGRPSPRPLRNLSLDFVIQVGIRDLLIQDNNYNDEIKMEGFQ